MEEPRYKSANQGRKTTKPDQGFDLMGRVMPQATQLEEAVLGAIMTDRDAISNLLDVLKPETFYLEKHTMIYQAMLDLFERGAPIDMLTVVEELRKKEQLAACGGPVYIAELTNKVASAANAEYHARIVSQKFVQRELISVATQITKEAFDDSTDPIALMDDAERRLFKVTETHLTKPYESAATLGPQLIKNVEAASLLKDGLTGVPTGFIDLDRLTNGWQSSDLLILAARPGMGKTSLVLALARNAAVDFNKTVAIFSLEMSQMQIMQRLVSLESEIENHKFKTGKLEKDEWTRLNATIAKLSKAPIFIDDTPGLNIFELRAKCRRIKKQFDLQFVIIDYLQLMSGSSDSRNGGGNREQEISAISRSLKTLAKELNVPVMALSQLSRQVEQRPGAKRPGLSDLRESGAIEQDADMVMFIYRPEYYKLTEDENGNSVAGLAELIVAKNRHGAQDTVNLRWIKEYTKFADWDSTDIFAGNGSFPTGFNLNSTPLGQNQSEGSDPGITTYGSRMNEEELPF
jgi:replicative DNA helicase